MSDALDRTMADLATLYEREAYRLLALAERVTCDAEAALTAAERAFVSLSAGPADHEEILAVTAACAIAEAPANAADARWAPLAALSPPLRAALALRHLCDAGDTVLAHALSLPPERAVAVLERAEAELAAAAALTGQEALERYAELAWPEPPRALWERVHAAAYTNAHARLEPPETAAPAAEKPARAPLGRRLRRAILGAGVLALAAGAVTLGRGGGEEAPRRAGAVVAPPPPAAAQPATVEAGADVVEDLDDVEPGTLTPEKLDRLRLAELREVSEHARDELAEPRRSEPADEAAEAIRRRLLAERRRAKLLRERLERERQEAAARAPEPSRDAAPPKPRRKPKPAEATPVEEEDEATECLYEEGTGSYICPEPTP